MTLHNHLLTNTISLPPRHHLLFLNSEKNVSRNRRHFAQNLSHAAAFFPPSGKKMDEVWGILAVFTRMQREKEGER